MPGEPDVVDDHPLASIRAFKLEKLRALGYKEPDARELSEHGVDVHYVEALLARGATLTEAARIAR